MLSGSVSGRTRCGISTMTSPEIWRKNTNVSLMVFQKSSPEVVRLNLWVRPCPHRFMDIRILIEDRQINAAIPRAKLHTRLKIEISSSQTKAGRQTRHMKVFVLCRLNWMVWNNTKWGTAAFQEVTRKVTFILWAVHLWQVARSLGALTDEAVAPGLSGAAWRPEPGDLRWREDSHNLQGSVTTHAVRPCAAVRAEVWDWFWKWKSACEWRIQQGRHGPASWSVRFMSATICFSPHSGKTAAPEHTPHQAPAPPPRDCAHISRVLGTESRAWRYYSAPCLTGGYWELPSIMTVITGVSWRACCSWRINASTGWKDRNNVGRFT